ncbi:MAG TPA: hypothetical protein VG940_08490 [Gemmatimonadales bacterium]|nr:hypothetical protein [Gemmatimonadales bacterium]
MSTWKRIFGLDVVNSILVAAGSAFLVIMVGELTGVGELALGTLVLCIGGYGILRHYALKSLPPEETSGSWRMSEVEARLAELEGVEARVAELEERLDFAERLLARQGEAKKLEAPR